MREDGVVHFGFLQAYDIRSVLFNNRLQLMQAGA
jgi:hypothetical protein